MFRLRKHLSWCPCAGRVLFLDVARDRYFCLPPEPGAAFLRVAEGGNAPSDLARLGTLVEAGVLIEDRASPGLPAPAALEPPTRDFLERPYPSPSLPGLVVALAAEITAGWRLRRRPLLEILDRLEAVAADQGGADPGSESILGEIVAASMRAALVLRATDRCLVRALAVHALCRRRRIDSKLVFGVRMNPFGAHSWVQRGAAVLVGDVEQARLYTPILAIG